MVYEAYCADRAAFKELLYIVSGEDVKDICRTNFPPYGDHLEYECSPEVQRSILVHIDNSMVAYNKVNWL